MEDFTPHGVYTISNACSILVELAPEGDAARLKINEEVTDWLEIEYVPEEDYEDLQAVIDPEGHNVPLNLTMKI
jgi:hypothetical protein